MTFLTFGTRIEWRHSVTPNRSKQHLTLESHHPEPSDLILALLMLPNKVCQAGTTDWSAAASLETCKVVAAEDVVGGCRWAITNL